MLIIAWKSQVLGPGGRGEAGGNETLRRGPAGSGFLGGMTGSASIQSSGSPSYAQFRDGPRQPCSAPLQQTADLKAGQGRSKVLFAFESGAPGGTGRPAESRVAKLGQTSVLETQEIYQVGSQLWGGRVGVACVPKCVGSGMEGTGEIHILSTNSWAN